MQIVIDIPESILNTIQADEMISREQLAVLQMHILNGTPLPKGHGNCDLISREETLTAFADYVGSGMSMNDYDALWDIVAKMPSVSTEKTGRWIFVDKAKEHAHCSECDYGNVDLFDGRPHNYCPNCGAKMEVEE